MKTKAIIPIAVVALFVTLAFTPAVSAAEDKFQVNIAWIENPNEPSTIQIDKIEVSTDVYQAFFEKLQSFGQWMEEARPFKDYIITEDEKNIITQYVTDLKVILQEFSPVIAMLTPEMLIELILPSVGGSILKQCVLSVGWGRTCMPFYQYEWGFSGGTPFIRPLIFLMFPGYTGVLKHRFPTGWLGYDKVGTHLIIFQGLQGLWIDGGKLGVQRPLHFGVEFVIGRARVFTIGRH
jgi:hypothetical protein